MGKAAQPVFGYGGGGLHILQVELHHGAGVHLSCIGHGDAGLAALSSPDVLRGFQLGIGKGGVAQTVAEGEQGLLCEVLVGAVFHAVIAEIRQLVVVAVEGHGQPSAGAEFSRKQIRHSLAAHGAGIPGLDNGRSLFIAGAKVDRAAAEVHNHKGGILIAQHLDHPPLAVRQKQILLVALHALGQQFFPFHGFVQAGDNHHQVCHIRHGTHFSQPVAVVARVLQLLLVQVAALGVEHPALGQGGPDGLQHRVVLIGGAVVVALQGHDGVGVGAYHCDAAQLLRIQGENPVVFQQHQGLTGHAVIYIPVVGGVHILQIQVVKGGMGIEHTQLHPGGHQLGGCMAHLLLRNHPQLHSVKHMLIGTAAV